VRHAPALYRPPEHFSMSWDQKISIVVCFTTFSSRGRAFASLKDAFALSRHFQTPQTKKLLGWNCPR
jgi:hypothetical protein